MRSRAAFFVTSTETQRLVCLRSQHARSCCATGMGWAAAREPYVRLVMEGISCADRVGVEREGGEEMKKSGEEVGKREWASVC